MNDSVVIYRSKMEQMSDEYWMSFLENNAEVLIWLPTVFFGIVLMFILFIAGLTFKNYFKINKKFK